MLEHLSLSFPVLVTIAGMAIVTLATRWGGYLLAQRMVFEGRLKAALEATPAAILTAIVTPLVITEGPAEALAAAVTLIAAWRFPTLVAIALGVGTVVLFRELGF